MLPAIQYSVHQPSAFIAAHQHQLLPDWPCPPRSLLIVLQSCSCNLLERSPMAETQKRVLRQHFLTLGERIVAQLQLAEHWVEVFDPRSGWPLRSRPGQLRLDDVAVVAACLGYPIADSHGCSVVLHPDWGSAVYPSILVSSAAPAVLASVVATIADPHTTMRLPLAAN